MSPDGAAVRVADVPALEGRECVALAEAENARMTALLASLGPQDWTRPTDCPAWDVRAMAGHVLGMVETFTSAPRMFRTMAAGSKAAGDGPFVDGMTAVQVRANAGLTTADLVARMRDGGPRQARWRGSRRLLRRIPSTEEVDGAKETWRLGYILDTILTRDSWMHRIDITRATGVPNTLTAEHDGRIVADVVAEWARRHGQPFRLHLTGPAGGTYAAGDGPELTVDAVEFCRVLSGRGAGDGLLAREVPF